MFFQTDKLFIDVSKRLANMYQMPAAHNPTPYPIKADAEGYGLYTGDLSDPAKKVWNAGAFCMNENTDTAPIKQMKHVWQQSVLMHIGKDRDVNAERIIFLYDNNVCVYPAQSFDSFTYPNFEYKNKDYYQSLKNDEKWYLYHIERNHDDYFGGENQVTTYFHKMKGFKKGDNSE